MDRGYYERYYDFERKHWWFQAREKILEGYIRKNIYNSKLSILNVGAATGRSTEWLMQFGEVISMEYDQHCIDFVKNKVSFSIDQGSILELPYPDKKFDLVCAFDVIEHVEDDKLAVIELARVCKEQGSVLVTVPAHMELWSEHDEINHHFRRYEIQQLEKLFDQNYDGEIFFTSYFNYRLYPVIRLARKITGWWKAQIRNPKKLKSDFDFFKTGAINTILYRIMAGEKSTLSQMLRVNNGVSIILHWKKK